MSGRPYRVLISLAAGLLVLQQAGTSIAKEARPPTWSRDVADTFFDDARAALVGPRPDYDQAPSHTSVQPTTSQGTSDAAGFNWSKLISSDTLETEVKRLALSVSNSVTSPSEFKGGGFKGVCRDVGELAVLFAVTAEYDGEARWKDVAAGLRERFARAARDCKIGTDASYREALAAKEELAELVRGNRPRLPTASARVPDWSNVAARPLLMQRLNMAHQERLVKWLADADAFRRNRTDVAHEAQIVAVLANVIHRESFEYWDDETFAGYAQELERAAGEISTAATTGNFEQGRASLNRATRACADCHEGYRG